MFGIINFSCRKIDTLHTFYVSSGLTWLHLVGILLRLFVFRAHLFRQIYCTHILRCVSSIFIFHSLGFHRMCLRLQSHERCFISIFSVDCCLRRAELIIQCNFQWNSCYVSSRELRKEENYIVWKSGSNPEILKLQVCVIFDVWFFITS